MFQLFYIYESIFSMIVLLLNVYVSIILYFSYYTQAYYHGGIFSNHPFVMRNLFFNSEKKCYLFFWGKKAPISSNIILI